MRFLMQVSLPVETFNKAIKDGSVGEKLGRILESNKPEAVYFTSRDGQRGGTLVVNMDNMSEMPGLAEPWFLTFNAKVEFLPAMTPEDIQKAGLDKIAQTWN